MYPTFTVVTPSYNQGEFIEDTIRSILSQKGDFYIEYIIKDGLSTDDSVDIIRKYDTLLSEKKYNVQCKGVSYHWESKKDNGQADAIENSCQFVPTSADSTGFRRGGICRN